MHGADVFFGLCADSSVINPGDRTPTVIFASSEIAYDVALARRPGSIGATVARNAWRGVARQPVDLEQNREELERRLGNAHE
jgi:hypothetical protein